MTANHRKNSEHTGIAARQAKYAAIAPLCTGCQVALALRAWLFPVLALPAGEIRQAQAVAHAQRLRPLSASQAGGSVPAFGE